MSSQAEPREFDVIVVGAGLAGLSAVRELKRKDPELKILVIEAKDRVGGRTLTTHMKGPGNKPVKFDLGGQWVGHTQRHIMNLIKELELKTYQQYETGTKWAQVGAAEPRKYHGDMPISTLKEFSPIEIIDWYANLSKTEKLVKQVDLKDPFAWKDAAMYDGMTLDKWCQENCITRTSHDCMDLKTTAIYGVKPSRVNMLYHLAFSKAAGTFGCLVNNIGDGAQAIKVVDGTQQMSVMMAEKFGMENVLLNRAVDEIDIDEKTGVTTVHAYSTLPGEKDVYEYFSCKRIILAIPPNQCDYIRFIPDVPLTKARLFESCPVGNFIKFIITYQTAFWRKDGHSGEIISTGRTSNSGEIMPLIEVYDACTSKGVPALVGFIGEEFTDMTQEERKEAIVKDLERFYGKKSRTEMVDYMEKLWVHEPFNGGCPTVAVTPGNMDAFCTIRQPHHTMTQPYVPSREHLHHAFLFLMNSGETIAAAQHETCQRWATRIKNGDFSIQDAERSGRPMELDLDALKEHVEDDPYLSTRDIAIIMQHHYSTIDRGLAKIGKVRKLGRWIPHDLSQSAKDRRVQTCTSLNSLNHHHPFLKDLITGDEKWVMYDNPHRRPQWVDADKQPQPIAKPDLHPKKVLLSCWWSERGMEYWELLPHGETITATTYVNQLQKLKRHLDSTRGQGAKIAFHHDNVRPHTAKHTRAELEQYSWLVIPQPPYSPDIAPSDYWLFSHLQRYLDGKTFEDEDDLKSGLTNFFSSQSPEFWRKGITKLLERWRLVVDQDGAYV